MRRLSVFNTVSLDGYFTDEKNDMSWAHEGEGDAEFNEFTSGNASGGGTLIFGRITYQLMASYWPTPQAAKQFPVVAEQMNALPKVVFSSSLPELEWSNARVTDRPAEEEIPELKRQPGKDIVVFGGAGFARSLAGHDLIDEYRINVHPVVLGDGLPLLHGLPEPLRLELVSSTAWADGTVTHTYLSR